MMFVCFLDVHGMGVFRGIVFCLAAAVVVVTEARVAERNITRERPNWEPRLVGTTPLKHAAFIEAYFSEDSTLDYLDRWTIYISTFEALSGYDEVYRVKSPGRHVDDPSQWNVELMDDSSYWPNNPDYMPSEVAGVEGIVWGSGFLVPGKKDGQVQLFQTSKDPLPPPINIASLDSKSWSYHRVLWKDMDLDGDLDALTARFHVSTLGATSSELVWLENEGSGIVEGWPQHVLAENGPDVSFALVTLTAGGKDYECIVAGEFWNQKVSIYWTESADGSWTDVSQVNSRIINEDAGQVFDVLVDDFNRDGTLEFLATEFLTDLGVGQVSVYFFPEDFRTDPYTHFKIADSFRPNQIIGAQTMSPGSPKSYYPTEAFANEMAEDGLPHKPYILLSGDDDGRMYILFPNSDDRDDWVYQKHILVDTEQMTIGKMAHGDFDGDGYEEVVVAGYSIGQLYLFTYSP